MKILDSKKNVVFSGDWYPEAVTVFWEEMEKDVYENSPMEFLNGYWEGSDHRERPLKSFFSMFPFLMEATADDTILYVNCNWYLVPWDMKDSDEKEAWIFWQKMLDTVTPGYTLVNE